MTHECVKTLESLLESAEGSTSTSSPSPAGMPFTSHASPLAATRSRSSWVAKGQSTLPVNSACVRASKLGAVNSKLISLDLRGRGGVIATRSPLSSVALG
eukprot:scaffold28628_cov48-Phaeocystis_antarctica.AAC.1